MLARMHTDYQSSQTTGKSSEKSIVNLYLCLGSMVAGALDELSEYSVLMGVALIVFGVLCGFFGKRLVKPVSFATGFLAGAGIALAFVAEKVKSSAVNTALAPSKLAAIAGAGGLVVGVLMVAFYKAVIFGLLGLLVAGIALVICSERFDKLALQIPIGMGAFAAGTTLASFMPKFSTIVVTSCLGSYVLSVGIDCVIKSGFNHIFAYGLGYRWDQVHAKTTDEVFGLMAFWIIMFIWMGVRQIFAQDPVKSKARKAIEAAIDA